MAMKQFDFQTGQGWQQYLEGAELASVATDFPRTGYASYTREILKLPIDSDVVDFLKQADRSVSSLVAATATLVARHSSQFDFVLGLIGNDQSGTKALPLRVRAQPADALDYLVDNLSKDIPRLFGSQVSDEVAQQAWSFAGSGIDGKGAVLCAVLADDASWADASAMVLRPQQLQQATQAIAQSDCFFYADLTSNAAHLVVSFDADLFEPTQMERLLSHHLRALTALVKAPAIELAVLDLMDEAERKLVLADWNSTEVAYSGKETLVSLFRAQVSRSPDAVALRENGQSISYRTFASNVDRIAGRLVQRGVTPGAIVAVHMHRSVHMLEAIYGIVCAGGAYLPIDPDFPIDRRVFMLNDAGASLVLSDAPDSALCKQASVEVLTDVFDHADSASQGSTTDPVVPLPMPQPDDLAYVLYTSGSTGQPKGVMIEHRAICNRLLWMQDAFVLSGDDVVIQKTPTTFDVSVWELFWPLQVGAVLVIARADGHKDAAYLRSLIIEQQVTVAHFVPSMLGLFLAESKAEDCRSLRYVVCSGEALATELVDRCHRTLAAELHNLYGPTEAAVDVTHWHCQPDEEVTSIPIGRPIANTRMYVLDEQLSPVPVGAVGELFIGGVQVARGYLNRPDLNAERFLANPFSVDPTERMYRTGDRGRWRSDGAIEYLGRLDGQIKLRGQRIEVGEIEAVLAQVDGVQAVAVMPVDFSEHDQRLIAFVMPAQGTEFRPEPLQSLAMSKLPAHMVPSAFRQVDQMPLSTSGKLDRKALIELALEPVATTVVGQSEQDDLSTEASILKIWQELLGRDSIQPTENFFDLGGHSFLVARVRDALAERLNIHVSMTDLFRYPTVRALVDHLGASAEQSPRAPSAAAGSPPTDDAIAIIGMSVRLPGAKDLDQFWKNLADGVEGIKTFSEAELQEAGVDDDTLSDPAYVRARGALGDIEQFDAEFFEYSVREAEILDPQQRIFLEGAWQAFEHAGYDPTVMDAPVGVYAGSGMNRYAFEHLAGHAKYQGPVGEFQRMIGNDKDFLSSRVAYKLNLHGPAVTVQTACSTSLVAVHMACEALRRGDCSVALAGGVSVDLPETSGYLYQDGMIVSADGHCRPFDADADGTVFANGLAIVILKPLASAQADCDCIHAVIKGSAINNDGAGKVGYTAPGVDGQIDVISKAQVAAGVSPESVGYVEAHGTGTRLGDPIEVLALTQAFRQGTEAVGYCGLGALKSSIGHTDAAAGAAGLIKTTLALKHKQLPATLHFKTPNSEIDFAGSPFFVVDRLTDWSAGSTPRRAGVSSFGIGGTNAHVILEEYGFDDAESASGDEVELAERDSHLLCLSGRSEVALRE
ncbi:MAG: amino acid adenylation domain-containing protein, partial [Burkholderiaceae bacterium]